MTDKQTTADQSVSNWLAAYKKDVFTQFGEDGIIQKIMEILPGVQKWCVEFGAWDGINYSNTHRLMKEDGWSGVFIEADKERFKDLCATYGGNERAVCLNCIVEFKGDGRLDNILAGTPVPENFDLLSIDIDGNDYHIWKSVEKFRPKVVVIEINNTIPNNIEFIQKADFRVNQGNSLLAYCNLAKTKGYELIAVTECNAFFVDAQYFSLFGITDNSPAAMNPVQKNLMQVFQLYDGTLVYRGCKKLLWHRIPIDGDRLQMLPKVLRDFDDGLTRSWWKQWLLKRYKAVLEKRAQKKRK
jgi:hypothetical protein